MGAAAVEPEQKRDWVECWGSYLQGQREQREQAEEKQKTDSKIKAQTRTGQQRQGSRSMWILLKVLGWILELLLGALFFHGAFS